MPEQTLLRSAYTHRSLGTIKSKGSSYVPPGALLIAPDGEVLVVGGPSGQIESIYTDKFNFSGIIFF